MNSAPDTSKVPSTSRWASCHGAWRRLRRTTPRCSSAAVAGAVLQPVSWRCVPESPRPRTWRGACSPGPRRSTRRCAWPKAAPYYWSALLLPASQVLRHPKREDPAIMAGSSSLTPEGSLIGRRCSRSVFVAIAAGVGIQDPVEVVVAVHERRRISAECLIQTQEQRSVFGRRSPAKRIAGSRNVRPAQLPHATLGLIRVAGGKERIEGGTVRRIDAADAGGAIAIIVGRDAIHFDAG